MVITAERIPVGGNKGQTMQLVQVNPPLDGGQIWEFLIWTTKQSYTNRSHQGVLSCIWLESFLNNSWDRLGPQEHCAQQENLFLLSWVQGMVLGLRLMMVSSWDRILEPMMQGPTATQLRELSRCTLMSRIEQFTRLERQQNKDKHNHLSNYHYLIK